MDKDRVSEKYVVVVDEETHRQLKVSGALNGFTVKAIVRTAIKEFLKNKEKMVRTMEAESL